jgi:hypothetical protein
MTEELNRHATNYGAGKVHLVRRSRFPMSAVLYCTGRTVSGTIATTKAVECKACLKRAKREGVEA